MKEFYRVCNIETQQGLWYQFDGNFTGLIHDKFNFCLHKDLKMDYDEELVGWLSATESLSILYQWFPKDDIIKLQEHNYFIHLYETEEFKFYDRFQHQVINQSKSKLIATMKLIV